MTKRLRGVISGACVAAMFLLFAASVRAQKEQTQFLPEVDLHYEFIPTARLFVQAKDDRDGGDPAQFTFGPSLLIYRKPLAKLERLVVFDLDTTKTRALVFESGYRVITAPNTPVENRLIEAVTFNFPIVEWFFVSDRNRVDLDWQNGQFTWRYRNRLTLQRTFTIRSYHFSPYVSAEPFYESQYGKWASTDLYVGSLFPAGRHVVFNPYYEHENDTGKKPNMQKNYLGLQVVFYFSRVEKAHNQAPPAR
jgi:hypothetical protein